MYFHLSITRLAKFLFFVTTVVACALATIFLRNDLFPNAASYLDSLKYRVEFNAAPGSTLGAAVVENLFSRKLAFQNADDPDAGAVPVLLYHGITASAGLYNMTPDQFKEQMFALKRAGWQTVTLKDFYLFVKGEKALPEKSFLLTFDDARSDSFSGADPVLRVVGYNAVMFVPTGDALHKADDSKGYYLGRSALKSMLASGRWEIGSHAVQRTGDSVPVDASGAKADFLSNKMWLAGQNRLETDAEYAARADDELTRSKAELESAFGVGVDAFAYPSSDYGQQSVNNLQNAAVVISAAVRKNYAMAFEQVQDNEGVFTANYPGDDLFHLRRVEPRGNWSGDQLVSYMHHAEAKALPYDDVFASNMGWKRSWGSAAIGQNAFNLKAEASTTGAAAMLDGSYPWKNYAYTAEVSLGKSDSVTLISRYQDSGNYISCSFNAAAVRIDEKLGGVTKNLVYIRNRVKIPSNDFTVSMSVKGSMAYCYEGAVFGAYARADSKFDHGGIGIQVWNKVVAKASMAVKSVRVIAK